VLGYQFVGLDNLLAEKFQFEMDKRHQKADWAMRPLTPAQLDYARLDTHFLFDLRDVLEAELKEKNRFQIAQEDFARACHVDLPEERVNGTSWKRFSLRKDVTPRELTVLSELCISRDRIAERMICGGVKFWRLLSAGPSLHSWNGSRPNVRTTPCSNACKNSRTGERDSPRT
jgi:ribonuclease D